MDRNEYFYRYVKDVYSVMTQCTLAIENYFRSTNLPFNWKTLEYYEEFIGYYHKYVGDHTPFISDSELRFILRQAKEDVVKRVLDYIDKHIVKVIDANYDVYKKYDTYAENKSINNPFGKIMMDLRNMEDECISGKEVSVVQSQNVMWFTDEMLEVLKIRPFFMGNEDGELGGHLMQDRVSMDLSYLTTREEREQLFRKYVPGVNPVAK